MKFVGIDPGVTTGVAIIDEDKKLIHSAETRQPLDIAKVLDKCVEKWGEKSFVVAIEDIVGAGARSRGVIYTLKLVGWVHWFCEYKGLINTVQPPQRRRPYLKEAVEILKANNMTFSAHQKDSLGHALSYREVWLV